MDTHAYSRRKSHLLEQAETLLASSGGRPSAAQKDEIRRLIADAEHCKEMAEAGERIESMRGMPAVGTTGFGGLIAGEFGKAAGADGRLDTKALRSVDVSGARALGLKAPTLTDAGPATWQPTSAGVIPIGQDRRYVYANMPSVDAGDATSVDDFRVTNVAVTGSVERAIAATTDKAVASPTVVHVNTPLKQHAVIIDALPNALLGSMTGLRGVLDSQGRHLVSQSLDAHVYGQLVEDAPNGTAGSGLVAQVRNAVGAVRSAGHVPDLLIVSPDDAVSLDLFEDSAGQLVFSTRTSGDASPLFGLRVIESPAAAVADPLLVATGSIGRLYLGRLAVDADPFAGAGGANFKKNLTDLRFELAALMHIADASASFRIGA
jgi:hypothetical protein